ncbi:MAG: hypothetical protein MZV64_26455 [Ignavibacteriales bacterium]|nr:hypothetical protein [Ignavibacteriales bacterium]
MKIKKRKTLLLICYLLIKSKKALIVASSSTELKSIKNETFADIIKNLVDKDYSIYFIGLDKEKAVYEDITSF